MFDLLVAEGPVKIGEGTRLVEAYGLGEVADRVGERVRQVLESAAVQVASDWLGAEFDGLVAVEDGLCVAALDAVDAGSGQERLEKARVDGEGFVEVLDAFGVVEVESGWAAEVVGLLWIRVEVFFVHVWKDWLLKWSAHAWFIQLSFGMDF